MIISIPKPHGDAIAERTRQMQEMANAFQMLRMEDKRHTDAVVAAAGLKPADYEQYELKQAEDGQNWMLDLKPKVAQSSAPQLPLAMIPDEAEPQHVNGAVNPQ